MTTVQRMFSLVCHFSFKESFIIILNYRYSSIKIEWNKKKTHGTMVLSVVLIKKNQKDCSSILWSRTNTSIINVLVIHSVIYSSSAIYWYQVLKKSKDNYKDRYCISKESSSSPIMTSRNRYWVWRSLGLHSSSGSSIKVWLDAEVKDVIYYNIF